MVLANKWPTSTFENFPVHLLISRPVDTGNGTEVPGAPITQQALRYRNDLPAFLKQTMGVRPRAWCFVSRNGKRKLVEDVPGFEPYQPVRTKAVSNPATLERNKKKTGLVLKAGLGVLPSDL
jgi:hypothetical protein